MGWMKRMLAERRMRKNVDWGRWMGTENILVVEVVVELEVKALYILEGGHDLHICVRAVLRVRAGC